MIIRIFTAREPAKPLNDAQMCGSFLFLWVYGNKNSVYKNIFHTPRVSAVTQNKRNGDTDEECAFTLPFFTELCPPEDRQIQRNGR